MSIERLFDHKCDIYHIVESSVSPGFNLPSSPSFQYPSTPDTAEVDCHFSVKSNSVTITQGEPMNVMEAKIKLALPIGTDIRLNDKIIDCSSQLEYTAEHPRIIRGHHIAVYVKRVVEQRAL